MSTVDPNETVKRIGTKAGEFAAGTDDDPKAMVDPIMADIEAAMAELGDGASDYLETVGEETKLALSEAEEPDLPNEGEEPHLQRRVRFLRSMAQLLDARRAVGF